MGTALDLLGAAVRHRGADFIYQPVWVEEPTYLTCLYANGGAPDCIVGHALAHAGIDVPVLEAMYDDGVEDLYSDGRFPCRVTLGALAVLRSAQQSQDRGCRWGEVFTNAQATAVRILDLLPDAAFELAMPPRARVARKGRHWECSRSSTTSDHPGAQHGMCVGRAPGSAR